MGKKEITKGENVKNLLCGGKYQARKGSGSGRNRAAGQWRGTAMQEDSKKTLAGERRERRGQTQSVEMSRNGNLNTAIKPGVIGDGPENTYTIEQMQESTQGFLRLPWGEAGASSVRTYGHTKCGQENRSRTSKEKRNWRFGSKPRQPDSRKREVEKGDLYQNTQRYKKNHYRATDHTPTRYRGIASTQSDGSNAIGKPTGTGNEPVTMQKNAIVFIQEFMERGGGGASATPPVQQTSEGVPLHHQIEV